MSKYKDTILSHYKRDWESKFKEHRWKAGPIHELGSEFSVLEFPSRPERKMITCATCCMSDPSSNHKIELHLFSKIQDESLVELLTVVAHYHRTGQELDLHNTVNFGRSWLPGSQCAHGFISLPYLDGPDFEILNTRWGQIHFYWLIPITLGELNYKKAFGVEALENKLESGKFDYMDPHRESVA